MTKGLTIKQSRFVKRYIENGGNGTRAALDVYDTDDPNVAHAIASENLRKPTVQQAIRQVLEAKGLTLASVVNNIGQIANTVPAKVPAETALKANIELLKLHGAYEKPMVEETYKARIAKMGRKEIKLEMEKVRREIREFLADTQVG